MIWITLIAALIPLIVQLVQWLMKQKSLSPRQRERGNNLIFHMNQLKAAMVAKGCKPEGEPEE